MMKLWLTYIDNVSRGAWSPCYNLYGPSGTVSNSMSASHVYTKTLDYAASAYVFKCGPDGEDVIYWSKYYGVFPINTGASALSWDMANGLTSGTPKLNINFRYSAKRDLNPISLLEFNYNAKVPYGGSINNEAAFNVNYGHTSRPIVGCPYIELRSGVANPSSGGGLSATKTQRPEVRLKFKRTSASSLNDNMIYRSYLDNKKA